MLIKLSILLLYKRAFAITSMRYAIYVVGFFVLSSSISNALSFTFQCTPLARSWNIEIPGHCVNQPLVIMLASMFSFLTDCAIYIMPMPVIWRLQLAIMRKVELTLVFAVGGFVCLTGVARLKLTIAIDPKDLTYTTVGPTNWCLIESEIGLVAGNMLSMGPLFRKARAQLAKLRHPYAQQKAPGEFAEPTRHALDPRRTIGGSEMKNDDSMRGRSKSVTAGKLHVDGSTGEDFLVDVMIMRANLEQISEEAAPQP
ncbi:hypothetical protein MMC29_007691, partial [Sticta canariensis]|nr:hypothetical protein [Sticta canariensis]